MAMQLFDAQTQILLIIDDNVNISHATAEYLETFGFQTIISQDGESGLAQAEVVRPDLILLDVVMPGWDGFETCRRLKANEKTKDIPVIFMTASEGVEDKVTGFEAGGVDYVTKPMETEELIARINTHLTIKHLTHQLQEANETLSTRVEERTAALVQSNKELQSEIVERQQRNRELALLNRVIAASVDETDVEKVLEISCRELGQTFGIPRTIAVLFDVAGAEAEVVAEYQFEDNRPSILAQVVPISEVALRREALNQDQQILSLVIDDAAHDTRLATMHDLIARNGTVSLLVAYLILDEKVIGALVLDTYEKHQFSAEQVSLTQSVAKQVSGVLARLRLNEERQQLQEQYYQSQKIESIGQLAGGIAHDFNNILVPIIGYIELGMLDLSPEDDLYANLQAARTAAGRAADLTRQILAFSRKQVLKMQVVDLNEAVSNFGAMIRRLIGEDIKLQTSLEPSIYQIQADTGQIEQILLNLVVNARDAMPNGGELTIETANTYLADDAIKRFKDNQSAGHYVTLMVSDTGYGMDAEIQKQIFEPFFTTKAQGQGTGLGLSTVFGIVKQHRGNIEVSSEPGKGTVFKIYFPTVERDVKTTSTDEEQANFVHGTEIVLVVEDEAMARELICETLASYGYEVICAASPDEALKQFADYNKPIDLLLTDVIMPGINGRQLYETLVAKQPDLRVLYMSGYTDNIILHRDILDEAVNFLQKPFSILELTQRVRDALR